MRRRQRLTICLFSGLLLLTACSHDPVHTQSGTPSRTAPAPSPTATIDPRAQPALTAYDGFDEATDNALRHPPGPGEKLPVSADFTKYSFDPFRADYESYLRGLKLDGVAFRGTPPQHHVRVTSADPTAKPWPQVILSDCQTNGEDWVAYNVQTGAVQPQTTPSIPPPYRSTITMILFQKRWGVQKIKFDTSRTCSG